MNNHPRVVALILSYSGSVKELRNLVNSLARAGVEPFVVPTSSRVDASLEGTGIPSLPIRANPGFGAALTLAEQHVGSWDWLMPVNDDVEIQEAGLREEIATWRNRPPGQLVYLDQGPKKVIPDLVDVLGQVSLWGGVIARVKQTFAGKSPWVVGQDREPSDRATFKPFSIVAFDRNLWVTLGGFDRRLIYTFEDADFGRRANDIGASVSYPRLRGIDHQRSGTSRQYAERVLPVAAWSAAMYLVTLGFPPRRALHLCAAASLARLLVVPWADVPRASHIKGIVRSTYHLLRGKQPTLPPYGQP